MEVLFNIVWVIVTAALATMWLRSLRNCARGKSILPSVGVQLVALTLLVIILLPAISVTDDLQACTAPTEYEHLARRDGHWIVHHSPQDLPTALIWLLTRLEPAQIRPSRLIADSEPAPRSVPEYSRSLANRPPPSA